MQWSPLHRRAYCCVLGIFLSTLIFACQSKSKSLDLPTVEIAVARFPHQQHQQVPCIECHSLLTVLHASTKSRPKRIEHKSCNQAKCHAEEFSDKPTTLCVLCHESFPETEGSSTEATFVPYPPIAGKQQFPVVFSHRTHVDAARMEAKLGFHLSCIDCHRAPKKNAVQDTLLRPTHASCARCHAEEAAEFGTPTMSNCLSCHLASGETRNRQRSLIQGDLHFNHSSHQRDRKGDAIACSTCHSQSITASAEQSGSHATPAMTVCVGCHDNRGRVSKEKRMARCETCHLSKAAGLGAIAPRSHMPATERPSNHTRAFQRDHAQDAGRNGAACARCHTMLSGNRRNTCDECHQVMRPRDHVALWREYNHGPEAAALPQRCTTCHQVDFCVACHRSRPRSHFPLMEWRIGGHGMQASLGLRSCMTCHRADADCSGAGCHRGDGF